MKNFFRLLIEMFIIWVAAALFPERIAYDSYRTLALVAVTFVLTWVVIGLLAELLSLIIRSVYKELHADHETGAADNK